MDLYLAAAAEHGIDELGVSEHVYRFTQSLEFWRHPFWEGQARDDFDAYCEFVKGTPLQLGVESDFVPGAEDRIATLLEREFDYVIGSVHFLGAAGADGRPAVRRLGDDHRSGRAMEDLLRMARGGGQVGSLRHPRPSRSGQAVGVRPARTQAGSALYYETAVEAVAGAGIAVEVSTAGLRKQVGEIYPSPAFAEMCVEAGAEFALSSDAQSPTRSASNTTAQSSSWMRSGWSGSVCSKAASDGSRR